MTITVDLYRNKRVAVLGLGRSGLATAKALSLGGAKVLCWDDGEAARAKAEAAGCTLVDLAKGAVLDGCEALILSPGIPHTHPEPHPVADRAKRAGIPILGDIDLLVRTCTDARFVGITGTNGKSTTTALIGHLLEQAGRRVAVGGNLGIPALQLDTLGADGLYVLELSSYQLELCPHAVFDIAVLLNIAPDHLDRHGGMDGYVAAKARIFDTGISGVRGALAAVVGIDGDRCAGIAEALTGGDRTVVAISGEGPVSGGVYAADGKLIDARDGAARDVADLAELHSLPGSHNAENAAAAVAVARLLGLSDEEIVHGLKSFPGLPHRQQLAAIVDGVTFVNDSKATNAEAAARALSCYPTIYWIAGGRAKEGGFEMLRPHLRCVRHAFLIGEAANDMMRDLSPAVPATRSETLENAVTQAFALAGREGGASPVVLLSPACASFDQYQDFEARGRAFCRLVAALPGRDRSIRAAFDGEEGEAA